MKAFDKLQDRLDLCFEHVAESLVKLSFRERVMVIIATVLVTVAIIATSLWKMHAAAEYQQKRLNELKDNLVWMQTHVVSMKPADDLSLTVSDKIQRVSQQQGISVASQQVGEQIQLVAEHQNYAILANFMTQLVQIGVNIEKMELNKVDQQIKLTATVR